MSDIRFNTWLHQSGTGGITQVDGGHVGIGTTNPDIAVHTANAKKVNVGIVTANSVYAGNFYGNGSNLTGVGHVDKIIEGDTKVEVFDAGSQYISAEVNGSEKFRIDSTGRISSGKHGVGTYNDASEWFKVQSNDTAANISIVGSNDTHSSLNLGDEDDFNIQKIRSDHTNNSLQFFTNNQERLRIDGNGKVIVAAGQVHSSRVLARFGIDCHGMSIYDNVADVSNYGLAFYNDPNTNYANGIGFFNDDGQTCGGYIVHQDKGGGNIGDIIMACSQTAGQPEQRLRLHYQGGIQINLSLIHI